MGGKKAGRNDPCPCGSGKKFKKCCLLKYEDARKNLPQDQFRELEDRAKAREKLEMEVKKGFDHFFLQDFQKAQMLGRHLLNSYPDDDRLHDNLVTSLLALGDYDEALIACRERSQVALEHFEASQNQPHLQKARERLVAADSISGVFPELEREI